MNQRPVLPRRRWLRGAGAGLALGTLGSIASIGSIGSLGTLGLLPRHARAAPGGLPSNVGHADSSPQWETLRARLFGERPIASGADSAVTLQVPLRAAYGASVPVKILARHPQQGALALRRLSLLVDKNPSPLAATLTLAEALGQVEIETRLRVDEYSHVRVVGELADGSLHTASRYVKVSGGCSAPPNRDAPHRIGETRLRLPEGLKPGAVTPLELSVLHPNDTGFELNQVTVMYIPPHFVRSLQVRLDGAPLFEAETDFSISENPSWRFNFIAPADGRGLLSAEVEDSKERHYSGRLDLAEAAASARPAAPPPGSAAEPA